MLYLLMETNIAVGIREKERQGEGREIDELPPLSMDSTRRSSHIEKLRGYFQQEKAHGAIFLGDRTPSMFVVAYR